MTGHTPDRMQWGDNPATVWVFDDPAPAHLTAAVFVPLTKGNHNLRWLLPCPSHCIALGGTWQPLLASFGHCGEEILSTHMYTQASPLTPHHPVLHSPSPSTHTHTYANTQPVYSHSCTVQHLTSIATCGVVNNAFTTTASVNGQCRTVQGGRCPVSRGWLGTAQHTSLALTFLQRLGRKNNSKVACSCFSSFYRVPIAHCTLLALIYNRE